MVLHMAECTLNHWNEDINYNEACPMLFHIHKCPAAVSVNLIIDYENGWETTLNLRNNVLQFSL